MFEEYIFDKFKSIPDIESDLVKRFHDISESFLIANLNQDPNWLEFKSLKIEDGDEYCWYNYRYPMASRAGYAILRHGKFIAMYNVIMS